MNEQLSECGYTGKHHNFDGTKKPSEEGDRCGLDCECIAAAAAAAAQVMVMCRQS